MRPPPPTTTPTPRGWFSEAADPWFTADHDPARPASHVSAVVHGASKAAASMLTVQYARAVPEVRFDAAEPGCTDTELGGADDSHGRPVRISARNVVRMATTGPNGPTGTFQADDGELGR